MSCGLFLLEYTFRENPCNYIPTPLLLIFLLHIQRYATTNDTFIILFEINSLFVLIYIWKWYTYIYIVIYSYMSYFE